MIRRALALTAIFVLTTWSLLLGNQVPDGRMTGGGWFTSGDSKITLGLELHCEISDLPNNLEINFDNGNHFHLDTLTSSACFNTDPPPNPPAAPFTILFGAGTGSYNNVPGATINFGFGDHGEPGTDDTVVYMFITDNNGNPVIAEPGPVVLGSGNFQAHKDNK